MGLFLKELIILNFSILISNTVSVDKYNPHKQELLGSHVFNSSRLKQTLGPKDRKEAVNPTFNLHSNPKFIQHNPFTLHNKVQIQHYLHCYKVTKLKTESV